MFSKTKMREVQDPFKITDGQRDFAMQICDEYHERKVYHFKLTGSCFYISEKEEQEKEIMYAISWVPLSLRWAERGDRDSHWDDISTKAITYLHSLGFKTNEDIQKYLDDRILP
jgi:hypothetical protein